MGFTRALFSFFRKFFRCDAYLFTFSVGYWFLLLTVDIFFYLIWKHAANLLENIHAEVWFQ